MSPGQPAYKSCSLQASAAFIGKPSMLETFVIQAGNSGCPGSVLAQRAHVAVLPALPWLLLYLSAINMTQSRHSSSRLHMRQRGCRLLQSDDSPSSHVQVKGWQIETDPGIRTRSKAKQQQERWVMLPAPVKLFSLLVDTVGEQQEGAGPGLNGRQTDDDWEDASDHGLHSDLGSLGPGEHPSVHCICCSCRVIMPDIATSTLACTTRISSCHKLLIDLQQ